MPEPRPLENLAAYLKGLPILSDAVDAEYMIAVRSITNDAEMRGLRRTVQEQVLQGWKDQQRPYRIMHYRDLTAKCIEPNCYTPIVGGYMEISNSVTYKNLMIPAQVAHNLIEHQIPGCTETLMNMGNSPMGECEVLLNSPGLMGVLKGSDVPEEALAELEPLIEEFNAFEAEKMKGRAPQPPIPDDYFAPSNYERENNIVPFKYLLRKLVDWGAEDIHIKPGFRPSGVVKGLVQPCPDFEDFLSPKTSRYYAWSLMSEAQQHQFEDQKEMDLSFEVRSVARFRCNIYWSLGTVGMVLRVIGTTIRPPEVLGVPPVLKKVVFERMGLVLVTGQTGSGKTTTLAALLEFANQNRKIHVLTLENPIEYVYESKAAIFTQRAIEIDSLSFPMAMRGALREKPDIILIGEMRDQDTINAGLKAAETGHLVVSTLHTSDAVQTIARLVNAFPPHEQETIRLQLATTIRACIAQRLVPRFDKPGRVCAIEVLLVTPNARGMNTRDYIARNELKELYKVIATSGYDGMQSNNQALFEYYRNGVITGDDALAYSDNPEELIRWMRQSSIGGGSSGGGGGGQTKRDTDRVEKAPA